MTNIDAIETKMYSVHATVSFDVVLFIEAEDEDDADVCAHETLIHCSLATNDDVEVENYFAHVDVRFVAGDDVDCIC
jgi:hypothetical protein